MLGSVGLGSDIHGYELLCVWIRYLGIWWYICNQSSPETELKHTHAPRNSRGEHERKRMAGIHVCAPAAVLLLPAEGRGAERYRLYIGVIVECACCQSVLRSKYAYVRENTASLHARLLHYN